MKLARRFLALALVAAPLTLAAQNATTSSRPSIDEVIKSETFVTPPNQLADAVLAPRYLNVSPSNLSPDRMWFINEIGDGPVTMDVFSKPFHELGGTFIDYGANRNRTLTIRNNVGLELRSATATNRVTIPIPAGARVSNATWSPDGKEVAYFVHTPAATHIWVSDLAGKARQVTTRPVLATLVTDFEWTKNGAEIVTVLLPDNRSAQPQPPVVPTGPRVKLAEESDKNMLRTYQSLMATPHDLDLLEWHATGQVAIIDVKTKAIRKVGAPRMVDAIDPSPDGKYVRITRMNRPFSYMVPVSNFGTTEEIVDAMTGAVLAQVTDTPLNLGIDSSRAVTAPGAAGEAPATSGKREVTWRPDGMGLTYLEQEAAPARADSANTADDSTRARRKDRVTHWMPPFGEGNTKVLYESNTRISTHRYSADLSVLFLSERMGPQTHEYAVFLSEPTKRYTIARFRTEDVNTNPGSLVMASGTMGGRGGFGGFGGFGRGESDKRVHRSTDGESVYLAGTLYDKDPENVGPRSFIDKVNIKTGQKSRVYLSENSNVYERAVAFQDIDARRLLVTRESETDVPQAFFRSGDQLTQITANKDYTPDLTRAKKENFIVERPDGFKFKVNVTMPTDYKPGTKVPAMFWFYPREYAGQEEYDRGARTFNKNAFPNFGIRSMQFLARMGYAVVEPDAPIVGKAGQQNNNYENDLRNNLAAVIDEVDRRGLVDRSRIGIGGHSYGAFSTVNAMSHTPFFKAGIAGDGNYNRTLTPLNFQSERRTLWDSRDTYLSMSPILHANNLTGALLMYHGMGDQNVGTELSNSPRLFHALNGLGKTTSMYLYPFEDHGPATKETMLDLWARWSAWLDKYVKETPKTKVVS